MSERYKYFPDRLRAETECANLTVDQVAGELGYKGPYLVQRWYDGEALPRIDQLAKLATVLGADVGMLLSDWVVAQEPSMAWRMKSFLAAEGCAVPDYA